MKLNPACSPPETILDRILKFGMKQVKLSRDKNKRVIVALNHSPVLCHSHISLCHPRGGPVFAPVALFKQFGSGPLMCFQSLSDPSFSFFKQL